MSATVGLALPVNGTASSESEPKDSPEYEKILNLRDQIYAGIHPRLKVPAGAIRKVTPRSVQTPPLPPPVAKEVSTGPPAPQTNGFSQHNANSARTNSQLNTSPSVSRLPPPKLNSSELDPIFLTKSDTLKHAEFQLKRQRIERALKDEYEQKKKLSFSQDDRPYFDVSEALAKALELVKPITLSDANGNATASESFDENSLYSSRAPDSTPERGHYRRSSSPRNHQHQLMDIDDLDADTRTEHDHGPRRQYPHGDRNVVDLHQNDSPPKNGPQGRYPLRSRRSPVQYESPRVPDDTFEEPEYSPPEPDEPSVVNRDNGVPIQGGYPPMAKPGNGRPYNAPYGNGSPVADVRIVRSHITSPAAPQPARISPLAVAKAPSIPQTRYQQQAQTSQGPRYGHESARTSPEPEILQTRKRRRGQEGNNRGRNGFNKNGPIPRKKPRHSNNSNTQRVQDSPEPYIKPEPVSPPSFSAVPSLAPPKVRQVVDRPGPIEIQSPREVRYVSYPEGRDYDVPRQYVSYTEPLLPPKIQHSCSRIEHRRPIREEQDLRRVASYNTRQQMLQQEYVEPLSPAHTAPVRGQSYAIIDRQAPPQPRQYYEDEMPAYSRQVVRSVRSPSPILHERYAEVEPQSRVMAPPQKRIVMDENGNKYYETVTVPRVQQSMAPPSRLPRVEYQEPIPMRQPSVRSTSVFEDPQSGRRYISEMPPPQPAYRRVAEVADPYAVSGVVERRVHDRPEFEQRPMYRSASVQVLDYPQRQPRYIEETLAPREDIVRMSSVRPKPTRYEDQPQVIQRVQSVRPEGREVSVFVDEPRRQREYVQAPLDRAAYEYVRQPRETRYIEDDDMGRVVMEGPRGSGPGAAQRY
jgi:hypothetical protein